MSEQTNVTVEVRLESGDLYRYTMSTIVRRFRFLVALYAGLAVYLAFLFSRTDFEWSWSFGNVAAPVFFFIFFPYAFLIAPYFSSKKYLQRNPNVAGPNAYTFSPEGIEVVGVQSRSHLNWEAIQQARETKTQFLLYPQTAFAHVIPKRFFISSDQQNGLRVLLQNHVKKVNLQG